MANNKFWTEERLLSALEHVLDSVSLADAAKAFSKSCNKSISRNALQKALSEQLKETHGEDVKLSDLVGRRLKQTNVGVMRKKTNDLLASLDKEDLGTSRPDYLRYTHEELRYKHFIPPKQRGDLRIDLKSTGSTIVHVWPDAHVPVHDVAAMEACTMFAEHMVPDIVVDMGDFLDLDEVSNHPPSTVVRGGSGFLYNSIMPGREILHDQAERLDKVGVKRRVMLGGNHENRFHRYIVQKCPEIYEMMPTIADMLDLEASGWDFVTYGGALRIGPVQFTHGRGHSKYVAARTMEREGSTVFGHTHRMQLFVSNTRPGYPEVAMTPGTRGMLVHDYQYHAPNDHVHGMGIVIIDPEGQVSMMPIIIHEGILTYPMPNGKSLRIDGNTKIIKEM